MTFDIDVWCDGSVWPKLGYVCKSCSRVRVQGHWENVPFSGESKIGKSNSILVVEKQTLIEN